jgi:hypothetical protein
MILEIEMSDATEALMELRARIDANRKLLEKQEAALIVMEEMMGINHSKVAKETAPLEFYKGGIDIKNLNLSDNSSKKTFKQQVKEVVELFGDQEFTVQHVFIALLGIGTKVNGNQPKARIAGMLSILEGEGLIVKTTVGKGSVPNKFKLASLA